MKAELLLRLLWLSMAGSARKPDSSLGRTESEVEPPWNCTLRDKQSKRWDLNCAVVDIVNSTSRQGAVTREANTSLDFQVLSKNASKQDLHEIFLYVQNGTVKCCLEHISNETTRTAADETAKLGGVFQSLEKQSGKIMKGTGQTANAEYDAKLCLPQASNNLSDYNLETQEPHGVCSVILQTAAHNNTVCVLHSSKSNFTLSSESLFNLVGGHSAIADAGMVAIRGCPFAELKKYELFQAPKLDALRFYDTPLETVASDSFNSVPRIKKLLFVRSKLKSIPLAVFSINNLEHLSVKHTAISPNDTFSLTSSHTPSKKSFLKKLNLKGTRLGHLDDRAFCAFPMLENLNLQLCSLTAMNGSPFVCLRNLKTLKLKSNKLTTLTNKTFLGLQSLTALKLTKNFIVFHDPTPVFAPLRSLDILHLGENKIDLLFPEVFAGLPVRKLTLAQNYISSWSTAIFSLLSSLETLRLDGNAIRVFDDGMYEDVANITAVSICYNPLDCASCKIKIVERFLLGSNNGLNRSVDCVVCSGSIASAEKVLVMDVAPGVDACRPQDYYVLVGVPLILVVLVGSVAGYSLYANRWYIRYFLLSLRIKVSAYRRLRCVDSFLWDAFVSYHSSDAAWVRDCLVPALESAELEFRLCVSDRDFVPGVPIAENVCRAIGHSRKCLFVVSRQFCKSRWCMFELTLAQHKLFESDRTNQMVLVRRELVEESQMCHFLRYLSRTKTYIQVPREDADKTVWDYFWLQLRAALKL